MKAWRSLLSWRVDNPERERVVGPPLFRSKYYCSHIAKEGFVESVGIVFLKKIVLKRERTFALKRLTW